MASGLAREFAHGIAVNTVAPSYVKTAPWDHRGGVPRDLAPLPTVLDDAVL